MEVLEHDVSLRVFQGASKFLYFLHFKFKSNSLPIKTIISHSLLPESHGQNIRQNEPDNGIDKDSYCISIKSMNSYLGWDENEVWEWREEQEFINRFWHDV